MVELKRYFEHSTHEITEEINLCEYDITKGTVEAEKSPEK